MDLKPLSRLFGISSSLGVLMGLIAVGSARGAEGSADIRVIQIRDAEIVEMMPAGASRWVLIRTNQVLQAHDRLRTGTNSRATVLWSDRSVVPLGPLTEIEILPPHETRALSGLHLFKGLLSFFHRDQPGRMRVVTPGAVAGIEGTEFVLEVLPTAGGTQDILSVVDGKVRFTNEAGALTLVSGERAVVEPGQPPVRTAGFITNNLLQWCFFYPGVLDLKDLTFPREAQDTLRASLAAYRQGDLLAALSRYPAGREPASDDERLYHAAVLLSVGEVGKCETELAGLTPESSSSRRPRLAQALRLLIAAVKREARPQGLKPEHATEFLAASYFEQSRAQGDDSLRAALDLARQAADCSPEFAFALERVAELEFGFGHTARAETALDRSLDLAPRNAQALALKGFLLAAENRPRSALWWFEDALAVDPALANAWLGRGLCRIRVGQAAAGREDLLVAAALEPQRALLRSYLGKAFTDAGQPTRAAHELALARKSDPRDPTSLLYSALLKQQQNRVNEAIADLEASQAENDNRSLFRSRLLLDEDRAVQSANLASIYRDAGLTDVGVREAARAVAYDYANPSAHLFLSDSYNALRDPTRFNLRYETVWFNELLLANLLSPVGGGRLAQHVSQQEYSPLFQREGLGLANSTLGRSDDKSVTEQASQFGTFGWTSYSLDLDYRHSDGVRTNNGLDSIEWYSTVKQQITAQDTLFALVKYEDYHSGDNFQYYSPTNLRPHFRFDEYQSPIVVGGWHHEWAPGIHTLALGGRLENEQRFSDRQAPQLLLVQDQGGTNVASDLEPFDINYHNRLEIYTAEFNQIFQFNRLTLSAGARYQSGDFNTRVAMTNPPGLVPFLFPDTTTTNSGHGDFERITGYGYLTLQPLDRVWITGGLSYDDLTYPINFRYPPVSSGEQDRSLLGPKAAIVWQPIPQATVRGIFTRSLGGVSLEESYRLEPTELAGFPQTFRSVIPESVVGSVEAPRYETFGAALDLKFSSRTYAGVQAERIEADVRRPIGLFTLSNSMAPFVPASTTEALAYREDSIGASLNQLVGDYLTLGISYRFQRADLNDSLPAVAVSVLPSARQNLRADLHQAGGYVLLNHPSGFFARADAVWYHQENSGYTPQLPGDDFVQENLYLGWRFARRRIELLFGILNLSGQDYRLNPLNTYSELPRERSFIARLNFIF